MRRVHQGYYPGLVALAVVLLLAPAAAPAPGSVRAAVAPAASVHSAGSVYDLKVEATGTYGYQPDTISNIPLATTINVTFDDDSSLQHSFNISGREGVEIANYANTNATELAKTLFSVPPLYVTTVNGPGDVSVGEFTSPSTPGWYEFVCNVTGHFQLGMFGYIAFGEAVPGNLTLPAGASGGGKVFPWAYGVVVFVVVLVALVGLLFRLRRVERDRALHEEDRASPIVPRPPAPP